MPRSRAVAIAVGTAVIVLVTIVLRVTAPAAPSFAAVQAAYRPSDARLLDRNGGVVHELRVDLGRRRLAWTPLGDVSSGFVDAVIAAEDHRFRSHGGVDWWAVAGLLRGGLRGASTITMQVAALVDPAVGRPGGHAGMAAVLARKWRQIRLARALERDWGKDALLEAYLNLVPIRGELEGVAAAAAVLFDKAPHGLTAAESCVLAVLLPAPNATRAAVAARAQALAARTGASVEPAALATAAARVFDAGLSRGPRVARAPHVARRLLHAGATETVVSTLDRGLQELAAEALHRQLVSVREQRVADGAVLAVDNASGDVLAYVGSSGALSAAPAVDGVVARRQPGSTLKPFIYALAIERRILTPASLVDDAPLEVATVGGLYRPRNYDERFRGLVSVRTALASSLNVPAVRTLLLLGADTVADQLRGLGFAGVSHDGEWYGPGLALGAAEVSLWELVNAYRTLANGGVRGALRLTPDTAAPSPVRVFSAETAFTIADILADREARAGTFGLESPLATAFWTAVKTGTSKDMRDNWCVGFTPAVTVGVWVGNASGAPMRDVSGVTGAAPAWQEIVSAAQARWPSRPPAPPPGLVRARVDLGAAEPSRDDWFARGTEPRTPGLQLAVPRARIVTPVSDTLVAIDPDIPPARQRLAFRARVGDAAARWHLDGVDLGDARAVHLWAPQPGRHELVLAAVDGGRALDRVRFEVRGQAVRTP